MPASEATLRTCAGELPQVGPALQQADDAVADAVPADQAGRRPVQHGAHAALARGGFTHQPRAVRDQPLERQLAGGRQRERPQAVIDQRHARQDRRVDAVGLGVRPVERPQGSRLAAADAVEGVLDAGALGGDGGHEPGHGGALQHDADRLATAGGANRARQLGGLLAPAGC
jgi:hypothetical protein